MQCEYHLNVTGSIKIKTKFPIASGPVIYKLETDPHHILCKIIASIKINDKKCWPTVQKSETPGIVYDISPRKPFFEAIKREIRTIEGLFTLHGPATIDTENYLLRWTPETEEEKKELQLYEYQCKNTPKPPEEIPEIPFDVIARSILSAPKASEIEVALSFFRKGRQDMSEERFIEAIYDFYFLLETVYADGKFKSAQVLEKFRSNQKLRQMIEKTLATPELHAVANRNPWVKKSFQEKYAGKTIDEAIQNIVNIRGLLHHHSQKRRDSWHPEEHLPFGGDAYFLQFLCYEVAFDMAAEHVFCEEIKEKYIKLAHGWASKIE